MSIVFITNFINHHQVHLADELYRMTEGEYWLIETVEIPESMIRNGYPRIARPYLIKAYGDESKVEMAMRVAYEADVAIIGNAPESFVDRRIEDGKMTFRYSERWFKSRPWFLTGPRGWVSLYKNHIAFRNRPLYMLCASAYMVEDAYAVGAYRDKCFKWGYFTKVEDHDAGADDFRSSTPEKTVHIMWCARFLKWKHPELPVRLAARLKRKGCPFVLDMFGSGEELEGSLRMARRCGVDDVVRFCGNLPNDGILEQMRRHDIFLFTSDRNEGWGAVLNEAMSSGCAVVGSDRAGAVPYLIEDGVNGCVFKSGNMDSLEEKVQFLIDNPGRRKEMATEAYRTMREIWSPQNAARQFLTLVKALRENDDSLIPVSGPCSRA